MKTWGGVPWWVWGIAGLGALTPIARPPSPPTPPKPRGKPAPPKRGGGSEGDMISYFVDPSGAILVKTHEAPDVEWGRPEIKTERLPAFQAMIARWTELVNEAGIEFRVPSREIFAIMWSESNGNPNAVSGAGAKGLMQVMPFHWPQGTQDSVMLDPRTNIRKGTEILAGRRAGGRHDLVQMASLYNAGGNTDGSPFTNDQRPKIATRWGYGAEPGYLDSVVAANNTAVRLGVIA